MAPFMAVGTSEKFCDSERLLLPALGGNTKVLATW